VSGHLQKIPRPEVQQGAENQHVSLFSSPPPEARGEASRLNSPVQHYPPPARILGYEQYVSQAPYVSRSVLALTWRLLCLLWRISAVHIP
jgi:hypothetical protein